MAKPTVTEFTKADEYRKDDRIVSKLTRRTGTVCDWPPLTPVIVGAVWVKWDDGLEAYAWRHQMNRR